MIRVRITRALGSTPREAGAEMIVGAASVTGTIGGGALEYIAIDRARQMLRSGEDRAVIDVPLGPQIGQCCGGRVHIALDRAPASPADPGPMVLIFGAGHVGRALAQALLPLPMRPVLIDQRSDELALAAPGVETRQSALPEADLRAAPTGSGAVILTHDHALDFLLAIEGLRHPGLGYLGMIGSATKRAQFNRFSGQQGLDPVPLICPIGASGRGDKRPAVIAAHTAVELLAHLTVASLTASPSLKVSKCVN